MRDILLGLIIALSLLGLADSVYIARGELTGAALTCNIDGLDGCNIVAQSEYSQIFGVPVALYGIGFYFILGGLAVLLLRSFKRSLYLLLCGIGLVGVLASAYFTLVQFAFIKAVCVYCLLSALCVLLIVSLTFLLYKYFGRLSMSVLR